VVSVLFPTTGRPERAETCLKQMRATTDRSFEVIAAVDADPITANRIAPLVDKLIVSTGYRGCSAAWHACLAEPTR